MKQTDTCNKSSFLRSVLPRKKGPWQHISNWQSSIKPSWEEKGLDRGFLQVGEWGQNGGLSCLSKDLHLTYTLPTSPHFLLAPGQFRHECFLRASVRHWGTRVSCCPPLWGLFVQRRGLIQEAVGRRLRRKETEWQGRVL